MDSSVGRGDTSNGYGPGKEKKCRREPYYLPLELLWIQSIGDGNLGTPDHAVSHIHGDSGVGRIPPASTPRVNRAGQVGTGASAPLRSSSVGKVLWTGGPLVQGPNH
ncbi:hypothetical protein DPEC_G00301420 [Dallia pectoralis]|uniref:Uncharacterized protein n=1 Tax=Dallia pectoralis TaxID=75939 RepID=A0ACC2FGW6_DALPE|nr:hypothetical protein DPEC_G00301420 [Dallia pectoralis]